MNSEQRQALRDRLSKLGLFIPFAFNVNDLKTLASTKTDEDLKKAYKGIQESISGVRKANLVINHSNHS